MFIIRAAKEKTQKIQVNYVLLLSPEIERRKAWLLDHEGSVGPTETNFKDFNEFKEKYNSQLAFKKELDENNIEELLNVADQIEEIDLDVKDKLKDLNQRWNILHDASESKSSTYENIMISWQEFREHQLTLLNWVDEKGRQISENKNQVNYADADEVKQQIQQLKATKVEAEAQGGEQGTKLNESGMKLIDHLGKDSQAAAEVTKQIEEVESCCNDFNNGVEQRLVNIESGERKTRDLYSEMDDVSDWLDNTDGLIDTYDDKKPQGEDEATTDTEVEEVEHVDVKHKGEVKEEKVHVVEELLAKRKQVSEKQETLDKVVKCVKDLDGELDESATEVAEAQVNELTDRWNIVIKRMDIFFSREIPEIEIAEIKAEHLDEDSLDETDLNTIVSMDEWRSRVRKLNLLLKYLERLVSGDADVRGDYPNIRILASNTKEATKSIKLYCKPRMEVVSVSGQNIVDSDPEDVDNKNEITETTNSLTQRMEAVAHNADLLKMKVRDLTLDYFNERFNDCEMKLEREEENVDKLMTTKADLETTQEQMVLLKEGRKEYDLNQNDFQEVVHELNDKKISEFLSKEGFQGTLLEKSASIWRRRSNVNKKLIESKSRIHRDLVTHLIERKRVVSKWLSACEKNEKTIKVEPAAAIVPADEYQKLKGLEKDLEDGEPEYQETVKLNQHLINEKVLEGRKAASSEKEVQTFNNRHAGLQKRVQDKNNILYLFLFNAAKTSMDQVQSNLESTEEKVNERTLSDNYFQAKQDFQAAQRVKQEVETVTANSAASLKNVRAMVALKIFTDEDAKHILDQGNDLKDRNFKLSEAADEKFGNFARQYNVTTGDEVKRRKMWIDENESWLSIVDNDVDDLPGFEKKLEEQKIFDEELERHKMADLVDEAENDHELDQDTKELIYQVDERWHTIDDWSNEREDKLTKVTADWRSLREEQKALLEKLDAKDVTLKGIVGPVDLSNSEDTNGQRKELKNLQGDVQELGLPVIKITKSGKALIKLIGVDTPAAKQLEKQVEDLDECRNTIGGDTLTRIKKLDSSARKTKSLYHHMDTVNASMDENANLLKALNDEVDKHVKEQEEINKDEGIELEDRDTNENKEEESRGSSNQEIINFVDQISLRLGDRPGERAHVERISELKDDLAEDLSEEAKDVLSTQVEQLDNRWEDLSKKMDNVVENNESSVEQSPVKAIQAENVEAGLPVDDDGPKDYGTWKESANDVNGSMKESQDALQVYNIDVRDYPSLKKTEEETQDIIFKMNTEYKPKLMTLRTSGERISGQEDDGKGKDITNDINSSQKNLEGLQSVLELRKLRLHDSSIQHINERITDCEAQAGEESVHLKLLSPTGKDLETILDQLSILEDSQNTFSANQKQFEEVQVHLNEMKQSKIVASPEFEKEFQDDCKEVALQRALVLKQIREYRIRIHRSVINVFETKRRDVTKWLKNCEKKEREVDEDSQDLDSALAALAKLQSAENTVEQGEANYHETVELSKTVSEHGLLQGKKATDAENDIKTASQQYNQTLEDIQRKKNKLYKTVYQLMNDDLNAIEKEIQEAEVVVQSESQPEDPTATHEELSKLQILASSSEKLREDSFKWFDKTNVILSSDVLPIEDKKEIRKRIVDLKKRAYDLPNVARTKYDRVYKVYVSHLTTIIRQREEWIIANEARMKQPETTNAADISELEKEIKELEDFEGELNKNNVRSVIEQIQDTNEIDPEVPLSELFSFEKRWEALDSWMKNREHLLKGTLENWEMFRDEEETLIAFIDKKNNELKELDSPVNLSDVKAVKQRLEALKNLRLELVQHSPNILQFDQTRETLLTNLTPDSNGTEEVKKQSENVRKSSEKLEQDVKQSFEKMEKSERTIQAIYTYIEVINSWLDETDGKLVELGTSKRQLDGPGEMDGSFRSTHSIDGGEKSEEEEGEGGKTGDESKQELSEDEKERLQEELRTVGASLKTNVGERDLNKARTKRAHSLVEDLHGDVDEASQEFLQREITNIDERWLQVEKRFGLLALDEADDVSSPVDVESQIMPPRIVATLESEPTELPSPESESEDSTKKSEDKTTPIEPYTGRVTLDINEWKIVVSNLRNFFIRMQLLIRDIDSTDYLDMRECERDTKNCIDAMKRYGRPCLKDILISGRGMLSSPEYNLEEKTQIKTTMEVLTDDAQFVYNHAEDQRQRLYRALVVYQNDQRKVIQRWLNLCAKKGKEVNEEAAGLEGSTVEYHKGQELIRSLAEGQPTFLNYKELSKRMINSKIIDGRKASETEKDITVFTKTYDDLRALAERKEKRLYTIVLKSIILPLESIERAVNEAETSVKPQDLSENYVQAKEEFQKMKLSVFVIETLNTRSGNVLAETEKLVSSHDVLSPEDKQKIRQRVEDLSPRMERLPAASSNKCKRMYREYLVLFEHEVQQREEWIEKNERKLTSLPNGDAKDLPDFLKLKDKHDEFFVELTHYDMSEFVKECESMSEIKKETREKTRDLQQRWIALLTWFNERTAFLSSIILKWQVFRQHEITVLDFIAAKERELQELDEQTKLSDDKDSAEHIHSLEKIQKETQANLLVVWNVQRQCVVLVEALGEHSGAAKHVKTQAADLADHNENFSKEILARINKLESAENKTSNFYEHVEYVTEWITPTQKLVGNFNDVASELPSSDETPAEVKAETESGQDSPPAGAKLDEKELERAREKANKLVYDIAVQRAEIPICQARVERVKQLQTELQDDLDESSKATLNEKVENLTEEWENVNDGIDKVAWQKIPGIDSLQARTYQIHDIKVSTTEEVSPVESFDEWKGKVTELEQCLEEAETKVDPKKSIDKDYSAMRTLLADLQDCQTRVNENCFPKLHQIRATGVKLFMDKETKQSSEPDSTDQKDGSNDAMKSEISTTVLSFHERTQNLQSSIELQKIRLREVVDEYLRERVRSDKTNISHEQMEMKKLLTSGENAEIIALQLDIMKERENEFSANDKTFNETREQFGQLNENQFVHDKRFGIFMLESTKNIAIQRKTLWKLLVDIKQKLYRHILNKYNVDKTNVTKWLKNIEKREKNVDPNVNGIEKVFTECTKLKSVKDDIGEGEENYERLLKLSEEIYDESIWDDGRADASKAEVEALGQRFKKLHENTENKQNTLHAKIKESMEETLNTTETKVSEAEAWVEPSTLSQELEQANVEMQKSMHCVTIINNKYTIIIQSLKRPQEMAQSGVLAEDLSSQVEFRCRDLSKRMSRLPSAVFKKHKSLYEAFTALLQKVVSEREKWISENESHVEVTLVTVASLDDVKSKVSENENFIKEVAKYDMEPVIDELGKMGDPDFELKATAKNLQSRWLAMDAWAKRRGVVLRSILDEWESLREHLKTLIDWIDSKDVKLQELKEQVNLSDEVEVKDELSNLKDVQTEMEDYFPEVTKLKRDSDGLIRILGADSEAVEQIEGQINEFNACWRNLGDEIQERIKKLESSERQLSTMYRYMDQTDNWIDEIKAIFEQHETNERRLQGLPVQQIDTQPASEVQTEASPEDGEVDTKDGGEEGEQGNEEEDETPELDEDGKEELRKENKYLVEAFVIKHRSLAKCQAFVDWAKELEKQVTEDLDDNSKESLSLKMETFGSRWDVFIEKMDVFSEKHAKEIKVVERRFAEYQSEQVSESAGFQDWQTETEEMEKWLETTKENCNQQSISKDSHVLKKEEKATKNLLVELTNNGQPRLTRLIILGQRLVDAKAQTPEEHDIIVKKTTTLTKMMIEVERSIELQRIRTYETIVEYCKGRLDDCETKAEHDEVSMSQLTPSGSTPEAVHDQIVILKVCEKEIPENDKEFREINIYVSGIEDSSLVSYETRENLEMTCGNLGSRRTVIYKLMRESHVRLYRTMTTFFDQHKKVILKWITNCEKKEKQVKSDVTDLRGSRDGYIKIKDVRREFDEGRQNYLLFIELHKTVVADEVFAERKAAEAEHDVNSITGRVERIDKILHDQETKLYNTLLMTLTQLLDSIENDLSEASDRIKPNEIISTYFKTAKTQMEETRVMARHVGTVHTETSKSIDEADEIKKAKLLGPEDADTMELRISDLTKKCTDIQATGVEKEFRMRAEYVTTFKTESQRCSQWITFLEIRVEKINGEAERLDGYQQLQEDHAHFEEDLKVYDLTVLLDEVDKIEELENSVRLEMWDLEKRWKKLLKWSEERKLRLFKIVSMWVKFRDEKVAVVTWSEEKNAKLKELEGEVKLTNQDEIARQLEILKGLRREAEKFAVHVTDVESMGHELKRIVGDHTNAGGQITKQLTEMDEAHNEVFKEILQRTEKIESAQRRLKCMLGDMEVVRRWANETEILLDKFDEKEKKLVGIDNEKSETPKTSEQEQEGEEELKKETKRQRKERMKEEKTQIREDMIALVDRLAVKFDKLSVNKTKVERVNVWGNELKEEVDESAKSDLNEQLQQFNNRWEAMSERLKDLVNKDLPQSNDCCFVQFLRRRFLRASITD